MTSKNNIIFCKDFVSDVNAQIQGVSSEQLFILTDTGSKKHCFPTLKQVSGLKNAHLIEIPDGDDSKNINTVASVWQFLCEHGGTRKSMLINLGGGMVTDLGGFAANTFKRGIKFINIPTTLLGMVDAAVGGKTGVNFNGFKNEIGVIQSASCVLINPAFLQSLDKNNILSGYAEMLKHGLLSNYKDLQALLSFDINEPDYNKLGEMVRISIEVKEHIVEIDPKEKGLRKALNVGHTIGHAFESYSHTKARPMLHGHAIALGLIAELYLSYKLKDFPQDKMMQVVAFIKENYAAFDITCKDYDTLYALMQHDKKNSDILHINFTLLSEIGNIHPDCIVEKKNIFNSLDFYRDIMGI